MVLQQSGVILLLLGALILGGVLERTNREDGYEKDCRAILGEQNLQFP